MAQRLRTLGDRWVALETARKRRGLLLATASGIFAGLLCVSMVQLLVGS